MTDYTISCKLSNETVYACYRGRFWRWDGSIWKESRIMTHRFELARAADKNLTPQAFLTNGAEFAPLDEYEIDCAMLDALENAKPCKNAPIEPMKEESECQTSTPATSLQNCESVPAASAGGSSAPMPSAPGFDFSALGDLSEQAVETDQQFDLHYGTAQDEYLISCIYVAKMHALTAKAGRYGGGTWTKWYESKGMSEGSARTMTQNGDAFKSATVADLKLLPSISRKDLNLIARSGCAEQLTAAAGDSQRVQELLAQLKAEKDRADAAEAHLEAANADINGLAERAQKAETERDKARADQLSTAKDCNRLGLKVSQEKDRADKAEARAKNAEGQLSGSRQVAEAAKLRADKLQEENAALKKQPIAAVVDEEEVERRANQRAHDIAENLAAEMTADLQARLEQASSGSEQDARDAYDSIILAGRSITSIVQSAKMQFRKLPDDQRETAINQFVHTLASAQGEVSACL